MRLPKILVLSPQAKSYLDQPTSGDPFRERGIHYVRWSDVVFHFAGHASCPSIDASSTRILGKTMRDAVRNKESWERRRTTTQDRSTFLVASCSCGRARVRACQNMILKRSRSSLHIFHVAFKITPFDAEMRRSSCKACPRVIKPCRQMTQASEAWSENVHRGCECLAAHRQRQVRLHQSARHPWSAAAAAFSHLCCPKPAHKGYTHRAFCCPISRVQ